MAKLSALRIQPVIGLILLLWCGPEPVCAGNPVMPGADPHAVVVGNTVWVFPTWSGGPGQRFFAFSSTNLADWERHGPVLDFKEVSWIDDDGAGRHYAWAPGVLANNGKWYFYYAVGPQHPTPSRIGVAVGNGPAGPFRDSGKPLLIGNEGFEAIDPMAFTDPKSGKTYLYAGGSAGAKLRVFELNPDLVSFAREIPVETPPQFTEGVFMHYRDGRYYLSYSHGGWQHSSYSVHYATADTPTGPWNYRGAILVSEGTRKGPGHHSFIQSPHPGEWLIVYHRWENQTGDGPYRGHRQVCVDRVDYDQNGLIRPITMTGTRVPGPNNWPEFRGPDRNGHAARAKPPLTWSETNNVAWKTPIHDLGWSSPVVWEDQVWITTATEDGRQMFALCVDTRSGHIIHDTKVFDTPQPEHVASVNSYASPTPAIEAGRVYVHYGTYGTACLDTRDGKVLWSRTDLRCDHHEGPGASLLLADRLYFTVDGRDVQYVIALDKATGRTVWKTDRSVDYTPFSINSRKAFCTPILIESGGRRQLFSPGAKAMVAYDPQSGAELWKARYDGWSIVPRPLFGHGLLYVVTDYERPQLWAVRPDGQGDVTETHVVWKVAKDMPATASLLLIGELLYMVNDYGFVLCLEVATGQEVWRQRLKGKHSASPIYANDRIYFFSEKNLTTVIAPGREFRMLAENQLEDRLMATPAVTGDAFILRTRTHLYRIEEVCPGSLWSAAASFTTSEVSK